MLFQTSLGVDLQDNAVSLAYLRASFRDVRLAAYAVYPIEKGMSETEKADRIGGLLADFLKKNSIAPAGVFLGVPRDSTILRYVELPLVTKENLRESLGYEMEKYVPFALDEVYFDYQITEEDKGAGKIKILLVAARKEAIDLLLDLANRIGVKVSGVEVSSTAMANYFSGRIERDGGDTHALIYLRDQALELNVLTGGVLSYSRSFTLAEHEGDLHELILQELKRLKQGLGQDQERLATLFCGPSPEGALVDRLRDEEEIEVRLPDLSRTGISSTALVPAYGLALKGISKVKSDINLVPFSLRKKASRLGYYTAFVLLGLVLLSALAWGGGNILFKQLHFRRLNEETTRVRAELVDIDRAKARCREVEERIDYLNGLYAEDIGPLNVLKELSERIPKSAWIRNFTFSDEGVRIEGRAESSSELIPSLESSPMFKDVTFLSSITRGKTGKELFRIGLKIDE